MLTHYQQELRRFEAQIRTESETRRAEIEKHQVETTKVRADLAEILKEMRARTTHEEDLRTQGEGRLAEQISALLKEMRERDEHLQDEHRVCFKQLSLEASETAVLEDRARRRSVALLEELTRRVESVENRKSKNRES